MLGVEPRRSASPRLAGLQACQSRAGMWSCCGWAWRTTWSSRTGVLVQPSSPCHDSTASHPILFSFFGITILARCPIRPYQTCITVSNAARPLQLTSNSAVVGPYNNMSLTHPHTHERTHTPLDRPKHCVTCVLTCSDADVRLAMSLLYQSTAENRLSVVHDPIGS